MADSLADLVGVDADDPRLTRALAALGFPRDLVPVIEREQDVPDSSGEGGGCSTLNAPARAVRVTFFQANDGSWCLRGSANLRYEHCLVRIGGNAMTSPS